MKFFFIATISLVWPAVFASEAFSAQWSPSWLNDGSVMRVEADNGEIFWDRFSSFDTEDSQYAAPVNHTADQHWLGFSVRELGQESKRLFNYKDEFEKRLRFGMASYDVSNIVSQIPDFMMTAKSTLQPGNVDAKFRAFIELFSGPAPMGPPREFKISPESSLKNIHLHWTEPQKNVKPQRFGIESQDESIARLSQAVIQIVNGPQESKGLTGESSFKGTGFFVSEQGHLLTNRHVIEPFSECLTTFSCILEFHQIRLNGESYTFKAPVEILLASTDDDVVLAKVSLELVEKKMSWLEIDSTSIGPNLLSLGYPGDRNKENHTDLTFSYGSLIGTHGLAFSSSIYISQGASGSPVLDLNTLKVVGLNSNGVGLPHHQDHSMPAIFRSIHLIEQKFKISSYLSEGMGDKVHEIISGLKSAANGEQAEAILQQYFSLRTMIGMKELIDLIATHPAAGVRFTTLENLRELGFIAG